MMHHHFSREEADEIISWLSLRDFVTLMPLAHIHFSVFSVLLPRDAMLARY